jgi:integrase
MVEFLAWTGIRPGEMKALAWEDVHINEKDLTGYININSSITRAGNLKMPKTPASVRKVELFPDTVRLLCKQKKITFNQPIISEVLHLKHGKTKKVDRRRVFLSRDNQPYKRPELTSVSKQWANWLIEAGVPHRPPYQLRHTYASRMLKSGCNHVWLAKQMGHTDWGMIRITYGCWIDEGEDEINKILANLSNNNTG